MNAPSNLQLIDQRNLFPLQPTSITFHSGHALNQCNYAKVEKINKSLSGEIAAFCFRHSFFHQITKYLSEIGDSITCNKGESLKLIQIRWSDEGLHEPVGVKIGITDCNTSQQRPTLFPTTLNQSKTFTLGLPLGTTQTFPSNAGYSSVKKEALDLDYTLTGSHPFCHKITLLHQGDYASDLSISCLTSSEQKGNSFFKYYNPTQLNSQNPIVYCQPIHNKSYSELIFRYFFRGGFPRNQPVDAELSFDYKLIQCSKIPEPRQTNSAAHPASKTQLIAFSILMSTLALLA